MFELYRILTLPQTCHAPIHCEYIVLATLHINFFGKSPLPSMDSGFLKGRYAVFVPLCIHLRAGPVMEQVLEGFWFNEATPIQ